MNLTLFTSIFLNRHVIHHQEFINKHSTSQNLENCNELRKRKLISSAIYYENKKMNADLSKAVAISSFEVSQECRNILLKVALQIKQTPFHDRVKIIEKISSDYNVAKEKVIELLGMYLAIVRLFLETSDKEFNSKLLEYGFTNEFILELPLANNRAKILETILGSRRGEFNRLVSLKWRIDISLTNSTIAKKIPASVILCLQLKDGRKFTININIRTFHKLRYNVALIMKEVATLKVGATNK